MDNFQKLVQAGLANDSFSPDERDEINDLSSTLVDKIIATASSTEGLDGGGGVQG